MRQLFAIGFVSLAVILSLAPVARAADAEHSAKVREILQKHVTANGPGAVVAVLRNGEVVYQGAFGHADVEEKTPLTQRTVFDLASCSKQFTAMAVMVLAEHGKLSFDDDARKYLPELKEHNAKRPIRIRDMLHMISGLPEYTGIMGDLADKTNTDVLNAVARKPLAFPTGTKFEYCNTNYALLALIVERVSKKPFAEFVREDVFIPAGMKETMVLDHPGQAVKHRAQGYTREKGKFEKRRDDTRVVGDGQVMMVAEDMGHWDRALREGKVVKGKLLEAAFTAGKLENGKSCDYGFGWFVGHDGGQKFVNHEGEWAGTNTFIVRYLGEGGLTVIVLSNIDNFDAGKVGDEVAAVFLKARGR